MRKWRSAKKFYKKHKKGILIGAGLAAVALLAQPVLIPAIMHGNLMLSSKITFLRPALQAINNVLGKAVGANVVEIISNGVKHYPWRLASGAMLEANTATASILKGIASVSLGAGPLIGGAVMALKFLNKKMKVGSSLRTKAGEIKENAQNMIHSVGNLGHNNETEKKSKPSRIEKDTLKNLRNLSPEALSQVMKSLSDEDRAKVFAALTTASVPETQTEEEEVKKGGRK